MRSDQNITSTTLKSAEEERSKRKKRTEESASINEKVQKHKKAKDENGKNDSIDLVSKNTPEKKMEPEKKVSKPADADIPGGVMNILQSYIFDEDVASRQPPISLPTVPLVATLFDSITTIKTVRLRALLRAVVNGNPDEAKMILDKDPSLLYEKLEEKEFVTALSGHRFNLKPYQAALAVSDTQMAEMIKPYFEKLRDEKEADRQYIEEFPHGWEQSCKEAEEKEWKPLFEQRDKLLCAIRDRKEGDITSSGRPNYITAARKGSLVEKELHAFWKLLDETKNNVITPGKIAFPPNLLLKPLQMYDDDKVYEKYFGGRWDDSRALFFVQKVVGYEGIQGIMPVNYVQAHQDWLDVTATKLKAGELQKRGTRFEIYRDGTWWDDVDFYPLRARGTAGFNFMIYGPRSAAGWGDVAGRISKLMSIKNSRLTELMPQTRNCRSEPTQSCCAIM